MGDPITIAAIGLGVLSAGGQIAAGKAASNAESIRQSQLKSQTVQAQVQALDQEVERRRQLSLLIGEQQAAAGQSGFGQFMEGSSFLALRRETERLGQKDVDMIRLLGANQQTRLQTDILQSRLAASQAKSSAFIGATTTLLSTGIAASSLGSKPPPAGQTFGATSIPAGAQGGIASSQSQIVRTPPGA